LAARADIFGRNNVDSCISGNLRMRHGAAGSSSEKAISHITFTKFSF
jgi:hypothetical protein